MVATRPIHPGDMLLEVPEDLLLSVHSARRDTVLGPLLEQFAELSSYQVWPWLLHASRRRSGSGRHHGTEHRDGCWLVAMLALVAL